MPRLTTDADLREMMSRTQTIAVVGLSPKEHRDSFRVAKYLQDQGFRIIPVNPNAREVLGAAAYPSLADVPEPVDLVDVFRRPDVALDVAREAAEIGAPAIWFQLGVATDEAIEAAERAGSHVVADRCLMVEHRRLIGNA